MRGLLIREEELFSVEVRRGGVFGGIGTDLTLQEALGLGTRVTRRTLARTFRVRKIGRRRQVGGIGEDFAEPDLTGFRRFEIRGGRRKETPLQFIQLAPKALGTRGERRAIQQARKQSVQLNEILTM